MSDLSDAQLSEAISSERYSALRRLGLRLGDLQHWDPDLGRDPRLLVPIDVQALVVREDDDETMVRLPLRDGTDPPPSLDDRGTRREPGVHLLWAVPEALGRGRVVDGPGDPADVDARSLELPLLPDRWVVLRLLVPSGDRRARIRGWVLEADAGTVTPLADWPDDPDATVDVADPIPADRLDVQIGGPSWTTCYDAALGRLSLHDPLDDVDGSIDAIEGDAICYVVAGWWSTAANDPLNGVGSLDGYWERLATLGWDDVDHPAAFRDASSNVEREQAAAEAVGIDYATRFGAAIEHDTSAYEAIRSRFVDGTELVSILPQPPTKATLLHGRIHGIPLRASRPDNRPDESAVGLALAPSAPEVTATLASAALSNTADAGERRNLERLVAGLGAGLLPRMSQADMWAEIEHDEHRHGFGSLPGGVEAVDRFVPAPPKNPDPRRARAPRGPRTKKRSAEEQQLAGHVLWSSTQRPSVVKAAEADAKASRRTRAKGAEPISADQPDFRSVQRAAPRFHFPTAPVLAISGAGRERSAVERDEADGVLRCRTSDQVSEGLDDVLDAKELVPTIGSGAVPDEIRLLAREALAADPHLAAWRARVSDTGQPLDAVLARLRAEAAVNYAFYAADDDALGAIVRAPVRSAAERQLAVEHLLRHSLDRAVWSHSEGVTMWGQPWRPVFCEWQVDVELGAPSGWTLGDVDLERVDEAEVVRTISVSGRSPVSDGVAGSLQAAVDRWLRDERARDRQGRGLASSDVERALAGLIGHLDALDLLSVALDGIREQLLGLVYDRGLVRDDADLGDDGTPRSRADRPPILIPAGRLTLRSARLVDAFGRLLDLPVDETRRPARSTGAAPATLQLRPRLAAPARLHLRLVDPLALGPDAATAVVDQTTTGGGISPVAGYLLPDHIDESMEVFGPAGTPLGQVFHDGFSGAVTWEGAPGRTDVGPGAGPLDDGEPAHRRVGWIASGLVVRDAEVRAVTTERPERESSLAAMLHAVDTTLWTVDPFGSLGREHIAGLVGRPIAVVTAQLTLDVLRDLDDHVYAGTTRDARERAYGEIASTPFDVRLGSVSRADDGLLGYFVDDDYSRFFVVDRVIAEASVAGRPPIDSAYIVPDGTISIRHGQTRRLTLLMHPGGRVHLTSGLLPRQTAALSREWVHAGLSTIAPSARVGPLLIDADKVRLPKIAAFPADQLFTRRDAPSSWRDDPIVSATHTAYLPDQASMVQEGWIRIAPEQGAGEVER